MRVVLQVSCGYPLLDFQCECQQQPTFRGRQRYIRFSGKLLDTLEFETQRGLGALREL